MKAPRLRGTSLIALSLCSLVLGVRTLSSEIFLDGVTYASIARNLAEGRGSFWSPYYTAEGGAFRAHPPLALWLESLLFAAFGDHAWVERVYGLVAGLVTLGLVAAVWRVTPRGSSTPERVGGGWPVMLLLAMPLASWCWANNMLENTLVPLLLASTWLALRALEEGAPRRRLTFSVAAGLLAFAAICTKGPAGLFILAVPSLGRWLPGEARRRSMSCQAGILLGFGAAFGLTLAFSSGAREFAGDYWNLQFLPSLFGEHEVASSRLLVIGTFARELALPVLLVASIGAQTRTRIEDGRARATFFAACAVAAFVPFLASRKQMEWYIAPALPFAAMALAAIGERSGCALEGRYDGPRGRHVIRLVSFAGATLGLALALLVPNVLDVSVPVAIRDRLVAGSVDDPSSEHFWRDFRRDVLGIRPVIAPESIVRAANPTDWFRLHACAQRYLRATLSRAAGARANTPFVIVDRSSSYDARSLSHCVPVVAGATQRFVVFSCS